MSQFIEYEIRTVASDSRLYNTAKFPTYKKISKNERIPDFEKDFDNSVFMKYEEIPHPPEVLEGENEDEDFEEKKFFRRRRRWYHTKEYRWVMSDKDQKQVYHGIEDGPSSSKYVVLMPPEAEKAPFRLVPVQKWFTFKQALKYKALPMDKAIEALEKERNITSSFMKKLSKRKEEDDQENENTVSARKKKKVKFEEEEAVAVEDKKAEEQEEERSWFSNTEGKPKKSLVDDDGPNNEEDVEIMAIDRMGASGHGGSESFADFNEEFEDDEDDAGELAAEEVRDSEERFMQSAEDMREATEVDNELDDAEEEEDVLDAAQILDDEDAQNPLTRDIDDEDDEVESERRRMMMQKNYFKAESQGSRKRKLSPSSASQNASKKSNTSEQKTEPLDKSKSPTKDSKSSFGRSTGKSRSSLLHQIEQKVIEIIRLNGGKIKTKQLSKQIKKEFPISKQRTKEQRADVLKKAVLNLCTIVNDAVEGTYLVLK